jgi:hypothetical protein
LAGRIYGSGKKSKNQRAEKEKKRLSLWELQQGGSVGSIFISILRGFRFSAQESASRSIF